MSVVTLELVEVSSFELVSAIELVLSGSVEEAVVFVREMVVGAFVDFEEACVENKLVVILVEADEVLGTVCLDVVNKLVGVDSALSERVVTPVVKITTGDVVLV